MDRRWNDRPTLWFVVSVSFIATAFTTFFLALYFGRIQFQVLGNVCEEVMERCPESKQAVLEVLKAGKWQELSGLAAVDENVLLSFGYVPSDLWTSGFAVIGIAAAGLIAGVVLFVCTFRSVRRKSAERIRMLTEYLGKINTGREGLLWDDTEDEFSGLQDEIYKTVTMLYQTKEAAVTARNHFAENLANIAHQLKTPITAVSLAVQMMKGRISSDFARIRKEGVSSGCFESMEVQYAGDLVRIERQLDRLARLEEALLLLSRIDSGTLMLKKEVVDVFTVLTLASDQLKELLLQTGVTVDIPEMGGVVIIADPDWTMEAVMNLMKNCMEASASGAVVHCDYEKNPLYVRIRIWDEGEGFEKEDLPRLFERFYRGKKAKGTGIGIGLPLAKAIVEMQGGVLSVYNLPAGGACFEMRFYT